MNGNETQRADRDFGDLPGNPLHCCGFHSWPKVIAPDVISEQRDE